MIDRRRHKRLLNLNNVISAKYKIGLRFRKKDVLSVDDVSGGGIKLCLPEKLKIGTIVDLYIKLGTDKETLYAKGEVVWSLKSEKKCHPAGIIFTDIDPLSICKIYTYFQEHQLKINLT